MSTSGPEANLLCRWGEHDGVPVLTILVTELRADKVIAKLEEALQALIEQHKPKLLVLDLSHVYLMSSAGLRVMIWLRRKLDEYGGRFAIAAAQPHVKEVFETTRLFRDQFDMFPDVPSAVAALKEQGN